MTRPLTILSLISGDGRAGADKLAFEISMGLRGSGHRVIWACPSRCILLKEALASGLETYILDFSGSMDLKPLAPFMQFCRAEQVDVVNVHHSHGRHLIIAAKLLGLRAKTVFMRHCISGSTPYAGAFFYNLFGHSIAVSDAVQQSLLRSGVLRNKVTKVYGGINIGRFEKVPAELVRQYREQYARKGSFTIGIVARLGLHKGHRTDKPTMKRHEVLFKALAGIKEDFNLLVLGADSKYIEKIAEQNGLDPGKITSCGYQEDIEPFYKIMDLKVLPSPNEGLGLAIIEAMAAGVPCIGANSGGIREIITDGVDGFLFAPEDSDDLAKKIRILMTDFKTRQFFIENGRRKARERFAIEKTVGETESVFCNLARSGPTFGSARYKLTREPQFSLKEKVE